MCPISKASSPSAPSFPVTSATSSSAQTTAMPTPMLSVFQASSAESVAASITRSMTGGTSHAGVPPPQATLASRPAGSTRSRFSVMPPPVMWASAWMGAPAASADTSLLA